MKKLLLLMVAGMAVLTLSACSDDDRNPDDEPRDIPDVQLTLEDLAMYDGQDGNDAYIAVDGVVYDVTDNEEWEGGCHNGVCAGTDASEVIGNSPHGKAVLDELPIIGSLVDSTEMLELTLEELAMYDGQDGNDAYVAVDGVIYDVTDNEAFAGGCHQGICAGTDATEAIANSPHGTTVLDDLPVVGSIVESSMDVLYLTITDLAEYDGLHGSMAYIAFEGMIYDVTNNDAWPNGCHQGVCAGTDITVEIGSSPHGDSVVANLDLVGELVIDATGDGPYDAYLYLTLTDLSMYDGMDSNNAYIAVNDVLYDVTNVDAWSGGCHNGVCAGADVTDDIMNAPHGESVLANLLIIGELIPE